MDNLDGMTAFITGGASGIGFALAKECASRGMTVLLADIEAAELETARAKLEAQGARAFAYRLDVSDKDQYREVAAAVLAEHGAPYMLFNNAGVGGGGSAALGKIGDWEWTVQVNILGVAYGLSLFVPAMIESGQRGYVVNTASLAGLITAPFGMAIYTMTKHAVVSLTESLAHELREHDMHAAVICPGRVSTRIYADDRNRPGAHRDGDFTPRDPALRDVSKAMLADGLPPEELAARTFVALEERRTYVITHSEYRESVAARHRQIEAAMRGEPDTDADIIALGQAERRLEPLL
ncbi:hypothetical protein B5C34_05610 [Pacificimonas flava]|uniref:Short-chain dehydrogenase/reductase SDR n=2 Tax=Pacificimonas TaxID=1960290 RepID=A0A219B5E0_9SPHN|nr:MULTISPECIES: SDR family NAD(P)-dependent oxidoreductase [Pacificimonas]MBZ6377302.1 SDR family NAD(P)-dependent oxidoreductase [Pacificimonas aurantium]OWV32988.1 hypothetical protein B5C34_05610 [Pacificimonas flava]